ncbi:unnamed protein product, partial [marine sediment metagenome]
GNKANQAAGDIIFVNGGTFLKVLGCTLEDSWRDGIRFDGGGAWQANSEVRECTIYEAGSSGFWSQDGQEISVIKNLIKGSVAYGIVLRGDCCAEHNTVLDTDLDGIFCAGFSVSIIGNHINREDNAFSTGQVDINVGGNETTVIGNKVWYAGLDGIHVTTNGNLIDGNQANGSERHGIKISGDMNVIDGNIVNDNSASEDGTFDNIHLVDGASNNVIDSNQCFGAGPTWNPGYGINIAGVNCVGNIVGENSIS